jgi:hypothetical protein
VDHLALELIVPANRTPRRFDCLDEQKLSSGRQTPTPGEVADSGATLRKLEEWVAAQAGGVDQRHAGEARLTSLLVEAGIEER